MRRFMEKILMSACLYGMECKYCGGSNALPTDVLTALKEKYEIITVCPEVDGGLSTPRPPAERIGDKVINIEGRDVTAEYLRGAGIALDKAKENDCKTAILKELSPSCGSGKIYDGTFSHTVVDGNGVAAGLLKKNGIEVLGESRIKELL